VRCARVHICAPHFFMAIAYVRSRFVVVGVFDGHGGDAVAEYLQRHLARRLMLVLADERHYARRAAALLQRGVGSSAPVLSKHLVGPSASVVDSMEHAAAAAATPDPSGLGRLMPSSPRHAAPRIKSSLGNRSGGSTQSAASGADVPIPSVSSNADVSVSTKASASIIPPAAAATVSNVQMGEQLHVPQWQQVQTSYIQGRIDEGSSTLSSSPPNAAAAAPEASGGQARGLTTSYAPGEPDFRRVMQAVFESIDREVMRLAASGGQGQGRSRASSDNGGSGSALGVGAATPAAAPIPPRAPSSAAGGSESQQQQQQHTPLVIGDAVGACAVIAVLYGDALIIANVGDCEAWLCR
jgi:hypothetical protein